MSSREVHIGDVIGHGILFDPRNAALLPTMDFNDLLASIPRLFDLLDERGVDYVLVVDVDEYFFSDAPGRTLKDLVVEALQGAPAQLTCAFHHFGASGFEKQPASVRECFTRAARFDPAKNFRATGAKALLSSLGVEAILDFAPDEPGVRAEALWREVRGEAAALLVAPPGEVLPEREGLGEALGVTVRLERSCVPLGVALAQRLGLRVAEAQRLGAAARLARHTRGAKSDGQAGVVCPRAYLRRRVRRECG
jgi:hypothetical protein